MNSLDVLMVGGPVASPSFPVDGLVIDCPAEPQGDFHFYSKIQQSNLVPTISTLLGWPIPRNNIGVLLQSFLNLWKGLSSSDVPNRRPKRSISSDWEQYPSDIETCRSQPSRN